MSSLVLVPTVIMFSLTVHLNHLKHLEKSLPINSDVILMKMVPDLLSVHNA